MENRFGWIYFIHAPEVRRTKIGWSADDPMGRLLQLQTGSPVELVLSGVLPGLQSTEGCVQRGVGSTQRAIREWFHYHDFLNILRDKVSHPWPCGGMDLMRWWGDVSASSRYLKMIQSIVHFDAPWLGMFGCMVERWEQRVEPAVREMLSEFSTQKLIENIDADKACAALRFLMPRCVCCTPPRSGDIQWSGRRA